MATLATEFTKEVMSFREGLRYFALSLTRNEEDSNDLVQETMLKAFTYKERFQENTNLKAWLYTIMKNIFINNYRRNVKSKTILDHSPNTYYINLPQNSKNADPNSQLSFKELSETVNNLEDEYKIPFMMYFEGFKYKEIADHLNLPIGTVKSRIFLARKQLMGNLAEYAK
ncbi:MAG: sigma-70 family RNA polymerase sigma factor [Flavobacterium sp.]|nr:sigma-70 family RNA polymerase sigma factor [Flavobacterium sp.]